MVEAIVNELKTRSTSAEWQQLETIYFGGGTPSLLSHEELDRIFEAIFQSFTVEQGAEITLEANPDDLDQNTIKRLHNSPINRLSIGVQSFQDNELTLMNRAHSVKQARSCLEHVLDAGFDNFSLDLIFGLPDSSRDSWLTNLQIALQYRPVHLSCYGLTVEPKTALAYQIRKGTVTLPSEYDHIHQFYDLIEFTVQAGYDHYEISSFALDGQVARHNTNYWLGAPYIGIGPSAHSFDGRKRSWNIADNHQYIIAQQQGLREFDEEILSTDQQYNEYLMVGLRTKWGCSLRKIESFGHEYVTYFLEGIREPVEEGMLVEDSGCFVLTKRGKAFADRLASDLFRV